MNTRITTALLSLCWIAHAQPVFAPSRFAVAEVQRNANTTNPQTYRSGGFLRGSRYDFRKVTMLSGSPSGPLPLGDSPRQEAPSSVCVDPDFRKAEDDALEGSQRTGVPESASTWG